MVERMTAAAFKAKKPAKRSKYNAKRVEVDGIMFDSKSEAARWVELNRLQDAGEIAQLERQVKIPLWGRYGPIMTKSGKQQAVYVADFRYIDWSKNGVVVIEDRKGMETPEFSLKNAILAAQRVVVTIT
jgi:hypothetical protein